MRVRALLSLTFCLNLLHGAFLAPELSTCRVMWTFKLPCKKPFRALVEQVSAWSTGMCLDEQEKCMYEIINLSNMSLEINHTSPWTGSITGITFNFYPPAAPYFCKVKAVSTSSQSTTSNDYCLLYNLMDGSGLTQAAGYREICNEMMCPPKALATC